VKSGFAVDLRQAPRRAAAIFGAAAVGRKTVSQ